eukprot:Phypoly_transcript_17620.p1 GENE.Phypoly_transcript_17620~~Phypoly_transcript_17620.p1  ORF type:complete len:121 (+),score=15.85 Phypoly_transcript_17620:91-453(+)
MPGWMLVVFFLFGYVASSYHLPSLFYQQLIAVPDMSHKLLLVSAAVGLTLVYFVLVFMPLEHIAQRECAQHSLVCVTSTRGDELKNSWMKMLEPTDDEDDEDMQVGNNWNHMFTSHRGSF